VTQREEDKSGDQYLPHVVRLQTKGFSEQEIVTWFQCHGLEGIDIAALMVTAVALSSIERRAANAKSRRILWNFYIFASLGAMVTIFVIAWVVVGFLAATTLGELLLGGTVAAGLTLGNGIIGIVDEGKPLPVFVGSVLGFAAFLLSYIFIFEVETLEAITKALLIAAISAGATVMVKSLKSQEAASSASDQTGIVVARWFFILLAAGMVYLIHGW
jgi:hypothetical protein